MVATLQDYERGIKVPEGRPHKVMTFAEYSTLIIQGKHVVIRDYINSSVAIWYLPQDSQ